MKVFIGACLKIAIVAQTSKHIQSDHAAVASREVDVDELVTRVGNEDIAQGLRNILQIATIPEGRLRGAPTEGVGAGDVEGGMETAIAEGFGEDFVLLLSIAPFK